MNPVTDVEILQLVAKVKPKTSKSHDELDICLIKSHATRNDIVDDIVDFSSSTMAFNVAKIASARASLTISLTKSLRVAGPLDVNTIHCCALETYI